MTLSRFLRQHPEHIRSDLPTVNRAAILHLSNLRTQVTRAACLFFEDLFVNLGKSMEQVNSTNDHVAGCRLNLILTEF